MNIEVKNWTQQNSTTDFKMSDEVCFRCPFCLKLYKTSHDVFEGTSEISTPEFDCSTCAKSFLLTKQLDSFGLFTTIEQSQKSFCTCPKCSNLKPHNSDECPTCGVYASKYIESQKTESPVLFELNQQWQKVLLHFDKDQYHQDFINKCHLKLALNFAFQKYSDLQKTMGFDSLCEKYIRQIELRLEQQFKSPAGTDEARAIAESSRLTITQYLFISIGSIGMFMLIYNRFIPTFPNFNGLVMMLTVLAFGIGLFSNNKSGLKL